jgi:antitoxin YefM
MYSIYRLKANELDSHFLDGLKTIFGDKEIEIAICEVNETAYLMDSEANANKLGNSGR